MLLLRLVGEYSLSHNICDKYIASLRGTVNLLGRFLLRPPRVGDLTAQVVNEFLAWLPSQHRKPRTVKNHRTNLLLLWRYAYKPLRLVPLPPEDVRTVRVPEQIPTAFLVDELSRIIQYCDGFTGTMRRTKLDRRLWWLSLLNAKYDTALRLGDLLSIERNWIWEGGFLSIVQSKTGHSHVVRLRESTMKLIDELLAGKITGLIWPLWGRREAFYRAFRKIREGAGVKHGTLRWIRRSSYSYVEAEYPGMGAIHLGHRTPGLAKKYYEDPRIVKRKVVLPPSLDR